MYNPGTLIFVGLATHSLAFSCGPASGSYTLKLSVSAGTLAV